MKKTKKLLSVVLAALLVLSVFALPASAATLSKVTNLQAYNIDDDEVNLKWSKVSGADGYQVYVYNESAAKWNKLVSTAKTFYEVENLASAKVYKFRVRAYDKKASGTVFSDYVTITVATEPDEVENVKVSAKTNNSVTLSWKAVKGATGYQVYIYSASKGKYVRKTAVTGTSAKITGRKAGTEYKFKVRAYFKADGKSYYGEFSDVIKVKTSGAAAVTTTAVADVLIGYSKAESIALKHAKLEKNQVKFLQSSFDNEKGVRVYEVEFDYGGYEYEYEIDAVSGAVIKAEKSRAD